MSTEPDEEEYGRSGRGAATVGTDGDASDGDASVSRRPTPAGDSAVPAEAPPAVPPRRWRLLAVVAAVVLVVDVLTKVAALLALEGREPVRLLGGAVYLQIVRNPGAAFSLATDLTWVLSLIMIAVVIGIMLVARRLRSPGWAVGLGLILAGALGNLGDRLFRAPGPLHGHVVDFVSVFAPDGRVWPVFNAADSAICVGGALVVVLALLGRDYDGSSDRPRRTHRDPDDPDPGESGPPDDSGHGESGDDRHTGDRASRGDQV